VALPHVSDSGGQLFEIANLNIGRATFEIDVVTKVVAREAMRLAAMKLPVKCRFVQEEDW